MILTDEEIESCSNFSHNRYQFARAIEAAVLKKLAEQDVEPVAYLVYGVSSGVTDYVSATIINDFLRMNTDWKLAGKLYTETKLLAAQQRAVEACAKAVERLISGDGICADNEVWIHDCADAIRRGNWRI